MRIGFLAAAMAMMAASPALAQAAGDEADVRATVEALSTTWEAGDADAYAALFTEDADYMAAGGVRMTGRDAIWDLHAGAFEGIYAGSTLPTEIEHVTFIAPDVALVAVRCMVEPAPGAEPQGIQGRALIGTAIVRRGADGWKIGYMNTMPAAAADFQPPSASRQAGDEAAQ